MGLEDNVKHFHTVSIRGSGLGVWLVFLGDASRVEINIFKD